MPDDLPELAGQPSDELKADSKKEAVGVTDWDGHICGGLAIGCEERGEWLKFEGEMVEVSEHR